MIVTIPYYAQRQIEKDGEKILVPMPPYWFLQNRGAIIAVTITHPKSVAENLINEGKSVPAIQCQALIDSGASGSAITPQVADKLMLIQTGFQKVTSVQDEQDRPTYYAYIQFHWGSGKEVPVVSCPLTGFDCLIGRDIMMHWNITYNGKDGYIIICD